MEFGRLNQQEYQTFVKERFSHYTQSAEHFSFRDLNQKDAHLVGVKNEDGTILAACLLTEARSLKFFKYFYTHRGPVMDYQDLELVKFFYSNLTAYLKKHQCLFVLTDPYLLENIRDAKGNVVQAFDNQLFIKQMEQLGYQHQGYTIGYSQTSQIRWLSVLDLADKSEDQLLKEMDYQTRRNIKKTYEMDVQVRTLSIDETDRFFKLFRMAEEKHGFKFRDQDYFEKMQRTYPENSMLKLAYIDLENLLDKQKAQYETLSKEFEATEQKLQENPNSKKSKTKHQQVKQQLEKQEKKIAETEQLIKTDGKVLDLAAALYIYNDHEVYYLSSGSNPKYNAYMGAYRLQWEMIKFAKAHNIDRYNFYGITGDFSDDAEDKGVQRFKEGFNAHVEEYIGDFIKPVKPFFYKIYQLLNR
ncbi:methicillin resistance protein [Staphylococcus microti]|uniref:Aminoacyltransferase FemA n=1 Tax=Staphylococcus microti TaxID=569857 RepID=A0A0D6XUZ5_9STAP|nr:aminoacyltransferase [Staphylococcus microti]KIX91673.1 methicillin resistance protein [Staphylococcus microti]PNZ84285.1 aminoacyltransferase [Staphylococcus microti]SUM56821.1 fmhA protein [Staphylococcus microti]